MIDRNTSLSVAEINAATYFKSPFNGLMGSKQLTEYTIRDIEKVSEKERRKFAGQGALSKKVNSGERIVKVKI